MTSSLGSVEGDGGMYTVDPRLGAAAQVVSRWCGEDSDTSAFPGAVAVVLQNGKAVLRQAVGSARTSSVGGPCPMTTSHMFDVASLTKPVATATSIFMLMEKGLLCLDDSLDMFFPSLRGCELGQVRIWHLLTHTAGFSETPMLFEVDDSAADPVDVLAGVERPWAPGTHVNYSCSGYIILGRIVETITGMSLSDFARRNVFEPIGMDHTCYLPFDAPIPGSVRDHLVPTERRSATERGVSLVGAWNARGLWLDEWRARHIDGDVACGSVHDENAAWLGGVSGNAGLFSTADDLARFGQMWLDRGLANGRRLLSPATVDIATRNWTAGLPGDGNRGLGWQMPSHDTSFGDYAPAGSFGHTGFTGTGLWVVPQMGVVAVLLTNRLQFTRSNERVLRVRRLFLNAVLSSLG